MSNQLVFIEPQKVDAEPFTTSGVIALATGVRHDKIKNAIIKHTSSLETFGKLSPYGVGLGGRGNEAGYHLNEQQATLLITFLKNTPAVVAFKVELVRQFFQMRRELQEWRVIRESGKHTRRLLTDAVRDAERGRWAYKHLTDLVYKTITGATAAQIRAKRGAEKADTAKDYLTPAELEAVEKLESQIAVLVDLGMDYEQIKAAVLRSRSAKLIA